MNGAAIRLQGVAVRLRDVRALDHVDLEIGAGEMVALVGPSGAGKTSLLHLCNGMLRPTSGRVQVDGEFLDELSRSRLRRLRTRLGFVHQDLSLIPNLSVLQNVLAGRLGRVGFAGALRTMLLPRRGEREQVRRLLERVGIADKIGQRTDRLSGGQRQRVAIARALYQEPAALLADEPVASVDPARARDTVALMVRLSRDGGFTLCTSLHDLGLAREFFPRLVGLRDGRVVFDRRREEVTDRELAQLYDLRPEEMLVDGA